jgi:branched-chain amino acid transport system substrate-binding protein
MIDVKVIVWIRKSAFLLSQMILLFAFGCGPAPTTEIAIVSPTATRSPTPTRIPTAQPTETQTPIPTSTSFVPRAVIKIFSHSPLSGNRDNYGQDILRGAELAVQQLSGPLNEYSYKVELAPYDDQNLVETALANVQELAADPEILCGIGHYDDEITIAASDMYHEAGLAFVVPAITDPILTDRNFLEVNRLIGRADGQGFAAAQFVKAQGFGTIFIVSQRHESSIRNAEYFRTEIDRLGIKRVGSLIQTVRDENIDEMVSQIVSVDPELVYAATSANQSIPLFLELRAAGYMGTFLGTERLDDRNAIISIGAPLLEGGGFYYTITNPPADYYPDATKFVQDFEAQYGAAPLDFAARAYDATGVCLKAIEEATRAKDGTLPTRAEVATALRALTDYQGITGTYSFKDNGDPQVAQYYVYHITSIDPDHWDQDNVVVASYDVTPP